MPRKEPTRKSKRSQTAHGIPILPEASIESQSLPFLEFFERPEAVPRCRSSMDHGHIADFCLTCLEQRVAHEVFTGGCSSQTFMGLALAIERAMDWELLQDPEARPNRELAQAVIGYCGAASVRDPKNALLLCTLGTFRARTIQDAPELAGALADLTNAAKLDPSLIDPAFNIAVVYDYLATQPIPKSTRNRVECLNTAREKYKFVLESWSESSDPNVDKVKARLSALATYQPGDTIEPMFWLTRPMNSWNNYLRGEKVQKGDPLELARFETDDQLVATVIGEVLKENTARKAEQHHTHKGVRRQLTRLLEHLRTGEDPPLQERSVKGKLLEHFTQVAQRDGTMKHEILRAMEFFGETKDVLQELESGIAAEVYSDEGVNQGCGLPSASIAFLARTGPGQPRDAADRIKRLSDMYFT
ncbi:hypothetical protein CALVIDRAFT_552248 [Calocera viscosa TUFC12733]|uniref:Uncharacterized protein n=1 Tax=Calocera viscosa (strain TUFC12733) TaxID=1330018 RepID=A0A167RPL5_CALVF|nr:hypothetical protein CALVIDRAFT_552248 [Calocera viscosa TUFC12733]